VSQSSDPHIWLGPGWYAWLEFGPDHTHAALQQVAERLQREFGAVVVEAMPSVADEHKEYVWLQIDHARLLLMRKVGCGVGLNAQYPDVPLLLRIGEAYGAVRRGWRWPLYRAWRSLPGRSK